jgi:hypothetical protein
MKLNEFMFLPDGIYEFTTYMDETITGIPYTWHNNNNQTFVIKNIEKHNNAGLSIEMQIVSGILLAINVDTVDEFKRIK